MVVGNINLKASENIMKTIDFWFEDQFSIDKIDADCIFYNLYASRISI